MGSRQDARKRENVRGEIAREFEKKRVKSWRGRVGGGRRPEDEEKGEERSTPELFEYESPGNRTSWARAPGGLVERRDTLLPDSLLRRSSSGRL